MYHFTVSEDFYSKSLSNKIKNYFNDDKITES